MHSKANNTELVRKLHLKRKKAKKDLGQEPLEIIIEHYELAVKL